MTNKQKNKQGIRKSLRLGKSRAKKADQLQKETGIQSGRTQEPLRAIIRELITDGLPIGSLPEHGYWIIANRAELREVKKSLKSRISGVDDRITDLERAFKTHQKK